MVEVFKAVVETSRPRQWLKNLVLFAGLIFSGRLAEWRLVGRVLAATAVFSLLTSSIYLFNDVWDAPADRRHPLKKERPVASGRLPVPLALFFSLSGMIAALFLMVQFGWFFFWVGAGYLILHLAYTMFLKQVPIVDVMAIAAGFVLRVYAGAVVVNVHINVWLLLCVISFALFLAVGKRRSELTLLKGRAASRTVLKRYSETVLNIYISMFATATWLTYGLFTFIHPPIVPHRKRLAELFLFLPKTFYSQKLLMLTVPLVIYGVMRYLQLIYEREEGESPEKVLLSDKPLMATVIVWGLLVIGVIYVV